MVFKWRTVPCTSAFRFLLLHLKIMKLHLPKGLRRAVLACMAVVSGIATTVGTGIVTGGAMAIVFGGAQAMAAVTVDAEAKTVTVDGKGNTNLNLAGYGADQTIIFQMDDANGSGESNNYFSGSNKTDVVAAAVQIVDTEADGKTGFVITNGNSKNIQVFTGTVTGDGILKKVGAGANSGIVFEGDVTGYTGDITLSSSAVFTMTFGGRDAAIAAATNSATNGVAGTGNMTFGSANDTLVFNYSDAVPVYITNRISKTGGTSKMVLKGGAAYTFTKSVAVDNFTLNAGSAAFNAEASLGAITLNIAALTEASAAMLNAGSNALTATSLTLNGSGDLSAGTYNIVQTTNDAAAALLALYTGVEELVNEDGLIKLVVGSGAISVTSNMTIPTASQTSRGYDVSGGAKLTIGEGSTGAATAGSVWNYGPITVGDSNSEIKFHLWTTSKVNITASDKAEVQSTISLADTAKLYFVDGSYYMSGDITVAEGAAAAIEMQYAKGVVLGSLKGAADSTVTLRRGQGDDAPGVFSLQGANEFAGTVVLDIYNGHANSVNWVVLNNADALKNAAVNTGDDAAKNVLALNVAETSIRSLSGSGKIATYGAGLNSDGAGLSAATLKVTAADGTFTGTVAAGITLDISGGVQTFDGGTYEGLVNVGAGATLNVSGAITLGQTVKNAGTVDISGVTGLTLGAAIVDAATVSGKVTTYTLIDGGTATGLESATSDELKAAIVSDALLRPGTEWSVSNGALIITQTADNLVWSGGNITWKEGCTMDAGGVFDNNDFVDFTTEGALTATIEGDITAGIVTVAGGTDLTLAGSGSLTVGATLTVGSDSAAGSLTIGTTGNNLKEVILNGDSKLIIDTNTSTTFGEALGEGTTITGGILGVGEGTTLTYDGSAFNSLRLDVAGELVISGSWLSSDINVSGKLTFNSGDAINYNGSNTITVDGGVMDLGETRQSLSANHKLVLNNGTINGEGDAYGALDFFENGLVVTSYGTSKIDAPLRVRGNTTLDVQSGTLTISDSHAGATLIKDGVGTLAVSSSLTNSGGVVVNAGNMKMLDGSSATSAVTLAGGALAAEGTATIASLAGSGDITVAANGALTITNAAGLFNKKGSGALTIDTMGGAELAMNYEGVLTINTLNLNENALLTYGNIPGGNLIKIDALTTAVAVNGFNLDLSEDLELELGIASSVDSALISVSGLNSDRYQLVDDNGYWKLVVAGGTELDTDWDINWGAAGLAGAPTSLEATAVAAEAGELFLNGAPASLTGGNANVIVYGGTRLLNNGDAVPYVGNVWIRANEGQYKAIVGGHWANTWSGGSVGNFNGNTHIILDGATVGSIVGGTMQDGRTPVFTGNSYISVFSGNVTAAIIGAGTNAHGNTSVFTGSTNIFVYVPLATNNTNNLDNTTSPGDAVIGGGSKVDSQNRNATNTVNGSTNVTIDLSAYTGTDTEFKKKVIGGHYNWAGSLTANINGDTNVTVTGKSGMKFTDVIVGGSRISGGAINTTGTSTVTISGGATMNSAVAAGSYLAGNFTSTIGNTVLNITGGTYGGNVSGGSYVDASDATSNQGDSVVTITGGTFNGNVAGAAFLATRATTHTGDATLTATGSTFKGWVTGGVFTNSSTSTVTTGDVSMTLTDSSFSKLVAGGSFVGGLTSTNTIGDVSIVLDGVTLTEGLYGGVYQHAESSTSTVGDVTITLTGDGTISGNIWAAGGTAANAANITVASTTVKVADTVTFGSGAVLHGGFNKAATGNCVMTVTGSRSLIFTGDADQDRSLLSFEGFNKIGVETAGKTVTVGALTLTDAVTIDGNGTIKLAGAATFGGGATVDSALDLNGQTVTGDVTVNGALTSGGSAIAGTLTLADGATISDAASATNIAVGTYSNTVGLTATDSINVGTQLSSSAALTAGKIVGEGSVEITGGTVTLSDTTDAFDNSGATSISGAELAGTWAAAGVTIGSGTTVSGSITLRDSTINNTITSTGLVDLQGTIVLGSGVATDGSPSYSDGTNGFVTVDRLYNIVSGGTVTATSDVVWSDGTNELSGTFANGTLTVLGAKGNVYMIRDGVVTYDGSSKFDGATQLLITGDGTGSLVLDADVLSDAAFKIRSEHTAGSITINSGVEFDRSRLEVKHADGAIIKGEGTLLLVGTGLYSGPKMGAADEWTGTVKVSGEVNGLNIGALGNSASTIELAGLTGSYINNASNTVVSTVVLSGDVVLDDGYSGHTQTFEGAVEGTGALKFTCAENRTALTQTFNFSGDTSGWSGDITSDRSQLTTNIMFSGTSEVKNNISKTAGILNVTVTDTAMGTPGAVAVNGDVTATVLTLDGSDVTVNGDVSVDSMVVNQTATLAGGVTVGTALTNTGDLTVTGTLTDGIALTNSGTVSLSQDTVLGSLSGNGAITATDRTLTVTGAANGGDITAGALSLQGAANTAGDITLTGALTLGTDSVASTLTAGALDITGGITFNALAESQITAGSLAADLGLSISDALLLTRISQSATKSLTLMTVTELGGHGILLNGASEYDSADGQYRYTVGIGADGAVTITSKVNGLKWAGSDASNLWSEGDSWSAGVAPTDSDSVVFNGGGCSEVLLQGEVVAQSVTIDIGADIAPEDVESESYEFNGSSATDKLTIEKNLSVNAGELTLGVQTVVNGRTEVVAGAVLNVIAGNMDSRFGLSNAGELNISTGQTPTAVSVAGGDLVNTGTIYNAGMLQAGYGVPGAENTPNIINSGSIENIGVVGVDGDLNNTGSYVQTDGRLVVLGDVNNSTDGASPGDMDISGGTVAVTGAINNSADLTVSGEGATVSAGSMVNTGGTLSIESGSVTVGSEETPGTLDNSNGTIALGGDSTTGSLIVNGDLGNTGGSISVAGGSDLTVNGDVDNKAGGSIFVTGGSSLAVSGDLDNTGGDLSLSDSGTTAAIGGDLIMTDGTAKGTLTVGEGTALTVGGDLAASNVDLAFGGNVTVGGDVEIGTLNNNGIFTANGSADTEVHIGTLTNNGTLSVGKETEDGLAGGHLDIGTLSGEGAVNVGKEGSLTINSATTFTGQLNNLGTLTITTTTLDSAQGSEGQTAGNIITEGLTVTDNATGYNGGSYQLGNVQTDTLTIDGISPDTTRMSLSSLDSWTEGGKIKLVLSDIEDGTVTDGSYHLIELDEAMAGSIAEEFDLSNYGYNADGDYDRTLATVQSDYMQALLKANKYVTFSDVAPTDGVALLSGGTTDVYASITELSPELSVWNLNGTETMTEAGLTVLEDGKLVSDDILDNVQTVKVTGEQAIDLTGDITRVTLNNLTAAEGSATALTISGDGSADDSAAITTATDGFDGTLVLTQASADISGKVTTLQTGDDSAANLDLSDSAIEVTGTGVTLSGVVNKGSLNFGLGSDELGKEIIGGDVRLNGTAINVTQQDNSIVIDGVGAGVNTIADLGETSGSATVTLNGKGFDKYFSNARLEGGNVVADRNDSYVTDKLAPTSPNGAAGAALLDATLVYDNPQASREEMPDRAALLDAVDAGRVTDEELAAVAGASVATMGMALSGDVERQLRAIRNRTTSMGVNECVVNEGMPYFNAWVNAEGNRAELDKDGTLAGYTLDSWGGTVGFDVDFDPHFTAGLAITAMYGDLTASGPETKAEGDMDTYYVTLFARYAKSAWTHTFVGTIGLMDGSLDRTVSAGGRTYKTEGDTEGMSFGLMYEVGYVMPLDEDATACLQPIFNVMLRHAGVDSYTEKGSDAALDVDSQSVTTLTFGLGARLQAVVGESLYNRASIFEARALVKADVGDRSSEADVAFVGSSHTATVESAELGAVGVELGAGLTIPVGDDDGSIFIDGSVELRSGYTNVNGTVGYRINF